MIETLNANPNTEQMRKHKLFAALMCLFAAMFFARKVLGVNFPVVLFLVLAVIIALVSSREELIALVVSFVPFSVGFQYKYAILLCILIYILKFYKSIKYPKYAMVVVALFLWEMLHGFSGDFSLYEVLRSFAELIFLAVLLMSDDFDFSDFLPVKTLVYCSGMAVLIVMCVSLKDYGYDIVLFVERGIRFGVANKDILNFGFNYNVNGLGSICNAGIAGILLLLSNKKAHILDYISASILLLVGLMTVSRSFVLCFVGMIVLYFFIQPGSRKKKLTTIFAVAIAIIILLLVINMVIPQVLENLSARFEVEDITNGRLDLFAFYNMHIFSDWKYFLFGVGMQNYGSKVNKIHNTDWNVSHNGFQETVVIWGIVGLALLICLIGTMIKRAKKYGGDKNLIKYLPFICELVTVMSGQLFTSGNTMLIFMFAFVCMCSGVRAEKKVQVGSGYNEDRDSNSI